MRLRFTMDRRHGRPRELTRARPPTTLGIKVTGEGVGEVDEAVVSTFVAHRSSGGGEMAAWQRGMTGGGRCSVGVHSGAGEEERRASEVRDSSGVIGWLLWGLEICAKAVGRGG
jgi:hypothetical protein